MFDAVPANLFTSDSVGGAVAEPRGPEPYQNGLRVSELLPGLPNTPVERIKRLWVFVFLSGLKEKDLEWVGSPFYTQVAVYAGLEINQAWLIRNMFLAGQIDPDRVSYAMCGYERKEVGVA
jgi:hypothetical protein